EGRQGERGKNADDQNHHEELDERKALLLAVDPLGKLPQHWYSSLEPVVCQNPVQPPRRRQLGRLRRMSLPPEPRSFASPPRGGFAFGEGGLACRRRYRRLWRRPDHLPRRWRRAIPG